MNIKILVMNLKIFMIMDHQLEKQNVISNFINTPERMERLYIYIYIYFFFLSWMTATFNRDKALANLRGSRAARIVNILRDWEISALLVNDILLKNYQTASIYIYK